MTRCLLLLAAVAGCTTSAPTVTSVEGRGRPDTGVTVGTVSAPSPIKTPRARPTPSAASRSRELVAPSNRSGSLLEVTCYAYTGNRTASGKWPRVGMAASNTHQFGTRLLVEGIGIVTVEDRIGWGTDLDLYGPSEAYCRRFGRQHLRVEVLGR